MPPRSRWDQVVDKVRQEPVPEASPGLRDLYQLAVSEGELVLRRFRDVLDVEPRDLVHDLLSVKLRQVVAADNPRAFLRVALCNLARSRLRARRVLIVEDVQSETPGERHPGATRQEQHLELTAVLGRLGTLPFRDAKIFIAAAVLGEDRDELARVFDTSRANIDQIVHRVRVALVEQST